VNVDKQSVAEILRYVAVEAADHLGAGCLVGVDAFTKLLGVEPPDRAVEPTRSQNITASWRRSASGAAVEWCSATPVAAGDAAWVAWPQAGQNFAAGASAAPHVAHTGLAKLDPHSR
jgi:hypothetical protein